MLIKDFILKEKKSVGVSDLEFLISFVIKKNRDFIFLNGNFELSKNEIIKIKSLIQKRKEGFSVAVLVGKKEFYGRDFFVNENVLIPRPDTEILINEVLKLFENINFKIKNNFIILDIGTGSGIIPITLNLELKTKNYKPQVIGLDISKKALEVAKKNAKKYDLKINFLESNLLKIFKKEKKYFDIITANLPYIENSYFDKSISKEPDLALFSGKYGLNHYQTFFEELKKSNINFKFLFMEMADFQTKKIAELYSFFGKVSIIKDYSGKKRIVKVEHIK